MEGGSSCFGSLGGNEKFDIELETLTRELQAAGPGEELQESSWARLEAQLDAMSTPATGPRVVRVLTELIILSQARRRQLVQLLAKLIQAAGAMSKMVPAATSHGGESTRALLLMFDLAEPTISPPPLLTGGGRRLGTVSSVCALLAVGASAGPAESSCHTAPCATLLSVMVEVDTEQRVMREITRQPRLWDTLDKIVASLPQLGPGERLEGAILYFGRLTSCLSAPAQAPHINPVATERLKALHACLEQQARALVWCWGT